RPDNDSTKVPNWEELAASAELIQFVKTERESGFPAVLGLAPDKKGIARLETPKKGDPFGRLMIRQATEGTADPEADGLYLILSGTVRIARPVGGGELLLRQHDRDGFFGLMKDSAEAVTDVYVARLPRDTVAKLADECGHIKSRLKKWRDRYAELDQALEAGTFKVPAEPPEEVATKLLPATDLLRIDMDLCTRCDQCVQACAELHEGIPRFHRANPPLRFGKWEIARACVHCSDAPCQVVCPVGAITFEDVIVHIDQDQCIACMRCAPACPFDVVEMYPPPPEDDPADFANLTPAKQKAKVLGKATKCDRCLTKDYDPACVAACPYGASQRGSPEKLFKKDLRRWAMPDDPGDQGASARRD
ncbi:MAG TPA: 4Fe-4S dicluster domain-containing protein, partial [Gemmataceae bacterium]|nr:4Fe-4S dicluster domain-containing protein [Gemmataceae bacterium]